MMSETHSITRTLIRGPFLLSRIPVICPMKYSSTARIWMVFVCSKISTASWNALDFDRSNSNHRMDLSSRVNALHYSIRSLRESLEREESTNEENCNQHTYLNRHYQHTPCIHPHKSIGPTVEETDDYHKYCCE